MKMTALNIAPKSSWQKVSEENPLVATVKIESEHSVVETELSPVTCQRLLKVVASEIKANAAANMDEFVLAVTAIEQEENKLIEEKLS